SGCVGRVRALRLPDAQSPRICFDNGFLLDTIPGWQKPMTLPHDEKKAMLASAEGRAALVEASGEGKGLVGIANWSIYVINETFAPENRQFEGRSVADIARDQDKDPLDALLDIVVTDDLMTGFGFPRGPERDEDWAARVKVWRDPRTIV